MVVGRRREVEGSKRRYGRVEAGNRGHSDIQQEGGGGKGVREVMILWTASKDTARTTTGGDNDMDNRGFEEGEGRDGMDMEQDGRAGRR